MKFLKKGEAGLSKESEEAVVKPGAQDNYGFQTSIRHRPLGVPRIESDSAPFTLYGPPSPCPNMGSEDLPVGVDADADPSPALPQLGPKWGHRTARSSEFPYCPD